MAEDVLHFGAVRLRVNGSGNLCTGFWSLDNTDIYDMEQFEMSNSPGQEPAHLGNFVGQRARLRVETLDKDEVFRVNRIIIYTKPMWTQLDG